MTIPDKCVECGAQRTGIAEGRAFFACGTTVNFNGKEPVMQRSEECIESTREKGDHAAADPA